MPLASYAFVRDALGTGHSIFAISSWRALLPCCGSFFLSSAHTRVHLATDRALHSGVHTLWTDSDDTPSHAISGCAQQRAREAACWGEIGMHASHFLDSSRVTTNQIAGWSKRPHFMPSLRGRQQCTPLKCQPASSPRSQRRQPPPPARRRRVLFRYSGRVIQNANPRRVAHIISATPPTAANPTTTTTTRCSSRRRGRARRWRGRSRRTRARARCP